MNISSANIYAAGKILNREIDEHLQNRYTWSNNYIIILLLQVIVVMCVSEKNVGQDKRNDAFLTKMNDY